MGRWLTPTTTTTAANKRASQDNQIQSGSHSQEDLFARSRSVPVRDAEGRPATASSWSASPSSHIASPSTSKLTSASAQHANLSSCSDDRSISTAGLTQSYTMPERSESPVQAANKGVGGGKSNSGRRTNGKGSRQQTQTAGLASSTDVDVTDRDMRTTSDGSLPMPFAIPPAAIQATSSDDAANDSMTDTLNGGSNSTIRKLDKFGFIVNIDSNGNVLEPDAEDDDRYARMMPTQAEAKLSERRTKKWQITIASWDRRRPKVLLRRLRKGIPDPIRGRVWLLLAGGIREPGLYHEILRRTAHVTLLDGTKAEPHPEAFAAAMEANLSSGKKKGRNSGKGKKKGKRTKSLLPDEEDDGDFVQSKEFITTVDAIERDIHRTYPRHNMFFEDDDPDDGLSMGDVNESNIHRNTIGESHEFVSCPSTQTASTDLVEGNTLLRSLCDPELANLITNMENDMIKKRQQYIGRQTNSHDEEDGSVDVDVAVGEGGDHSLSSHSASIKQMSQKTLPPPTSSSSFPASRIPGGQLSLRRLLRAYSYYDREIGYCQGMNFIAGMFLTLMSEEEAFWMLVSVMHEKPCEMRGLFGEGMRETHMVLHVAEQLIHQFLPKLAKHFDKERIHVTMFATQWLLTQYTSSFQFDLVTRVWDCFLGEGWKIIYRVMLALLMQWQAPLLRMPFEDILGFFRDLPRSVEGHVVIDTALKIPLRRKHIIKYEQEWQAKQNDAAR